VAEWSGDYDCNAFQVVTSEDAKAWAAALSLALEDHLARIMKGGKPVNAETFTAFESHARPFIAACLAGGFQIF
jgi:hypothetical protein